MPISNRELSHVFLGGRDLEMVTIARLLKTQAGVVVHDIGLAWGARASSYENDIREALFQGHSVILVELLDDLPFEIPLDKLQIIDHHGLLAGHGKPTSIEQIFRFFQFPPEAWSRELALVSANDRTHIKGMVAINATVEEIRSTREQDRAAQGISVEEERQGREALQHVERHFEGRLTVVTLPHSRTATVTDPLDSNLGGPGYENLLILSPTQTTFFGSGQYIEVLKSAYPECWFGGDLPQRGYWGCAKNISRTDILTLLKKVP